MEITYTKLKKEGEWGIRVIGGTVSPGDLVTVVKKSGKIREEIIGQIVWQGVTGDGETIQLTTIEPREITK
jgi:hypothetical protein